MARIVYGISGEDSLRLLEQRWRDYASGGQDTSGRKRKR